jgi:hypothetical protein
VGRPITALAPFTTTGRSSSSGSAAIALATCAAVASGPSPAALYAFSFLRSRACGSILSFARRSLISLDSAVAQQLQRLA